MMCTGFRLRGVGLSLFIVFSLIVQGLVACGRHGQAAQIVRLSPQNWDQMVPRGKEVDCIYGDFVLRNEQIVVVIAQPADWRNANMTVRNVGGMIIDLTQRNTPNDQLSAYYPGGGRYAFANLDKAKLTVDGKPLDFSKLGGDKSPLDGEEIVLQFVSKSAAGKPSVTLTYTLAKGQPYLTVRTTFRNPYQKKIEEDLRDMVRADRSFKFGGDQATGLFWADDDWFRQAYGVLVDGRTIQRGGGRVVVLRLLDRGKSKIELAPGEEISLTRKIFPGSHLLEVKAIANQLQGRPTQMVELKIRDADGPIDNAKVTVTEDGKPYGSGRSNAAGEIQFGLPEGKFTARVEALGRPAKEIAISPSADFSKLLELAQPGYVVGEIRDEKGGPIPCKIAFHAQVAGGPGGQGGKNPFFGPDSGDTGVHNLVYSHNGQFRQAISPGKYDVVISRGPEYDAVFQSIEVRRGEQTPLRAKLIRTVDTKGWVSSDYHSHSSPSGDNTSSQLGRVQNLLAEHIEFAPCTEHNRLDTYVPHLKKLSAERFMATCTGMELTGSDGSYNHQNAFPLLYKPRTQDNGAPVTDLDPRVQIERLALWDNRSDKLVQMNHPNLVKIWRDKNLDGKADDGFEKMFGFVDVIEVHPPIGILTPPTRDRSGQLTRNPIFHWMQMLNQGYRMPGVVNTDAHYNHHGSGGLRNYIKSSTDDPAKIDTMEMVRASEAGRLVMSNGPFMTVEFSGADEESKTAGPGDEIALQGGKGKLHIRVQCANWLDINRVQVFVNGRPEKNLNFTRRTTPEKFSDKVVKFDAAAPITLKRDAHLIVAAAGEGLQLDRVMGSQWGKKAPIAVSNPIFVDVDGGGFKPNGDLLGVPLPKK